MDAYQCLWVLKTQGIQHWGCCGHTTWQSWWGGCRQPPAMGRAPLGLLAQEQTCRAQVWPRLQPPHLKPAEKCWSIIACTQVIFNTLVSAIPRELVTIYTSWRSSLVLFIPQQRTKFSKKMLKCVCVSYHSCSADLNGAIHMLRARPALKYTAESALVCVLKYNSDSAIKASAKLWYTPA